MKRPLYGSSLAPRDDGGLYDVVHCCDGATITGGWPHPEAVALAAQENALQGTPSEFDDAAGLLCLGYGVWRGKR